MKYVLASVSIAVHSLFEQCVSLGISFIVVMPSSFQSGSNSAIGA